MTFSQLALESVAQNQLEEELGLEGFSDILDYLSSMTDRMGKFLDKLLNKEFTGIEVYPVESSYLDKVFKKTGLSFTDVKKLNLYQPDNLNALMLDYSKELADQLEAYADVRARLYEPLNQWLARAASMDGFEEKIWHDRDLKLMDLAKSKKILQGFFVSKKRTTTHGDIALGSELYVSRTQFDKTCDELKRIAVAGKAFSLTDLKASEKKTVEYINALMQRQAEGDLDISRANRKQLANVLQAMAEETEYLVSLCYLGITTIVAWNDNEALIENRLEEAAEEAA